tara:strand:- start:75 stop:428 length:354 start_codon:yes stop_codon:yes gene_type:complete
MLLGHLGDEPKVVVDNDTNPLVKLSIATNEQWTDKNGEKQEKTTWHRVSVSGQPACFARDYLHKGNLVWAEGKNDSRTWEDDEGNKQYDYAVKAFRVENYSPKGGGEEVDADDGIPY